MRKRKLLLTFIIIIVLVISTATIGYSASDVNLDTDNINKGVLGVSLSDTSGKAFKLMVEKDAAKMFYDIDPDGTEQTFPLQLGNGSYKITVLINKIGTQYTVVMSKIIEVEIDDQNSVYLNSIKLINFNNDTKVVQKSKEITKNLTTDKQKIDAVYQYVIKQYSYDYNKKNLASTYVPSLNSIYEAKKGICYDYASTVAAMLRSVGIPTKLVMGSSANVTTYHAWNEVYDRDTQKWNVLDATKGSIYIKAGQKVMTYEAADKYQAKYYY